MKRLLLALTVCLVLIISPVSALELNFQDWDNSSVLGTGEIKGEVIAPTSAGKVSYYIWNEYMENVYPSTYDYAAYDHIGGGGFGYVTVQMYDSSHVAIGGTLAAGNTDGRYELVIVGMTPKLYRSGTLIATGSVLTVYPSYIRLGIGGGGTDAHIDNFVFGNTEEHVVGAMPTNWTIIKDMVTPTSIGVYANNPNTGALVLKDSSYFYIDADTSNFDSIYTNESLVITDIDGNVVNTTVLVNGTIRNTIKYGLTQFFTETSRYGKFRAYIPGTTAVDYFYVVGDGAAITLDRSSYSGQDTATATYNILGTYWDTSTYGYSIDYISGTTGATMYSEAISASSGTSSYTFTGSDPLGVYYAVVKATKYSDGSVIWMNYDYAELTSYVTITGYINDAETGLPISGANINITQGDIISASTTIADGNYTATNFLSGAAISINATAPLHYQYTYTFTPLLAKTINLNISLLNKTPVVSPIGIGGVVRDTAYGQPLPAALATGTNLTATLTNTSISHSGYYLLDSGNLLNESYYNVSGSKAGHSNSSIASVYVNGSVSNFSHSDIWMVGQYLQTFTITDSATLAAITNVSIVSSSGKSYQTTNGTGYLTEPFGLYTITFSSSGYSPRTISYVFDADASHAVALTESTSSTSVSVQGTPKDVKFHITSFWGEPIQNANVTIQGITTTTGSWDWVATLLSIDLEETPIQNTSMSGLTDTNGDAVFLMLASLKYNISVSKAGYTFPLTYISPQASQYSISANMNESWFSAGNDTLKEVNVSVSWVTKNATHAFVNITYQDDTGTTTGGDVKVYQRSAGRAVNASPIAVMNVTASTCSNSTVVEVPTGGASYVVDVNATTSTGTNIKRTFAHDFKGQPVNLPGFTPETQLWLAMFILIFTAAFAGVLHAPQMSIVLCVELWAFWAIRWFDHLIDGNGYTEAVLVTMFILATFAAFVWNITEGKSKGKRSS